MGTQYSRTIKKKPDNTKSKIGVRREYVSVSTRVLEEYENADKNGDNRLTFPEVQALMKKLNARIPKKLLEKKFREHDKDGSNDLSIKEFRTLFEEVSSLPNVDKIFQVFASGKASMSAKDLQRFLKSEDGGGVKISLLETAKMIVKYEGGDESDIQNLVEEFYDNFEDLENLPALTPRGFAHLLADGNENSVISPMSSAVYQDMTQPLSHYFISSSHNTYLSGNQFNSDSSLKSIEYALLCGVRVIELDAWDGSDGCPIVKHGYTLCKPIAFRDCIVQIKECAFKNSDYPVIITIENHCSIAQQQAQAEILQDILGDLLHSWERITSEKGKAKSRAGPIEFDSPEALKGKVLVRDKPKTKLPPLLTESEPVKDVVSSIAVSSDSRVEVSDDEEDEPEMLRVAETLLKLMYIKNVSLKYHKTDTEVIFRQAPFASSSSINEIKMSNLSKPGMAARSLCLYSQTNLIRVYPKGNKVSSSNFDPTPAWNAGCQIVALNYQTHTIHVWLNQGKFSENGGCGYVLKPRYMLESATKFSWDASASNRSPRVLQLQLISGHYLPKPLGKPDNSEVIDPYVEISMYGIGPVQKYKSKVIIKNGFNPVWNETFKFKVYADELTEIAFVVNDRDYATKEFIAQNVIPITALRTGLRVIPLKHANGVQQKHSFLFGHFLWLSDTLL